MRNSLYVTFFRLYFRFPDICCPITFGLPVTVRFRSISASSVCASTRLAALFSDACCPITPYTMFSFARVTQKTPREFSFSRCLKSSYALSNTTTSPDFMSAQSSQAVLGSESFALFMMGGESIRVNRIVRIEGELFAGEF